MQVSILGASAPKYDHAKGGDDLGFRLFFAGVARLKSALCYVCWGLPPLPPKGWQRTSTVEGTRVEVDLE